MLVDSSTTIVDSRVKEASYVDLKHNPPCRARLVESSQCYT